MIENGTLVWGFERENESRNMTMNNLPAGETLDYDVVSRLEHAVGFAQFSSIASPSEKESMTFGMRVFEFETFDGFVYRWELANKIVDGRLPVKVSVSLANGVKSDKTLNDRLRKEKAHYRGWVYMLPRATYAPLQTSPKAFLKARN